MKILYGPDFKIVEPTAVTIGKFDGLHAGHIKIINELLRVSKIDKLSSVIYTFDVNPKVVLKSEYFVPLMTNEEKSKKISLIGVDYLIYENFNIEFSNMLPEEFVKKVLLEKLNAKVVIMGKNSTFGKDRAGNANLMKSFGDRYGFKVKIVELMRENGCVISSTKIREER